MREKIEFIDAYVQKILKEIEEKKMFETLTESAKLAVGKPLVEAQTLLQQNGFQVVIESIDGVPQVHMLTNDMRPNRIRLVIENGIVTSYTIR